MFHHSSKLQYQVRVDTPDPVFAKYLQQAIGGVEGEIRVAMQYMFQAMGARGDAKYRDMLMMTATEELSHKFFVYNGSKPICRQKASSPETDLKESAFAAGRCGIEPARTPVGAELSVRYQNAQKSRVYATGHLPTDELFALANERSLPAAVLLATETE